MCGLFGFSSYGDNIDNEKLNEVVNVLAKSSAQRGTDATGIAYILDNKLEIEKEAQSAYKIKYAIPDGTKALIGHTRHSTQGSEKKNFNNHPFKGKNQNSSFALAHNGVLSNDRQLRKKLNLPQTKIETDSYITVQLLESKKNLNIDSIKYMAEQVEGSFTFSILDDTNNIFIVKGDSPISILHFKDLKLYIYASTDRILWEALVNSPLFDKLKTGLKDNAAIDEIKVKEGQILSICSNGELKYDEFTYSPNVGWWTDWWCFGSNKKNNTTFDDDEYLEQLKSIAVKFGYDECQVDELLESGYSAIEIEEMLYEPELYGFEHDMLEERED